MVEAEQFLRMLYHLFGAFPNSLKDGHILPHIQSAYWEALKDQQVEDLKKAMRVLVAQGGSFVPTAAMILVQSKKHATDRDPSAYHNEPSVPYAQQQAQIAAYSGDGLPPNARAMLPQDGRQSSQYTDAAHATCDHFLDLVRAMKFKRFSGGKMADTFISAMQTRGSKRYESPHGARLKQGHIPNAADATCLAFAAMLDEVALGQQTSDGPPHDIGGRPFWTFSSKQKEHICRTLSDAQRQAEAAAAHPTQTSTAQFLTPLEVARHSEAVSTWRDKPDAKQYATAQPPRQLS